MPVTTMNDAPPVPQGRGRVIAVVIVAVALSLGGMSWPHFTDGLAQERAVPVPNFMLLHFPMPRTVYQDAASALSGADSSNGEAWLQRAEAGLHTGAPGRATEALLFKAMSCQPGSARARVLLAEVHLRAGKAELAVRDYQQAMMLAPKDYYLFYMRAELGARLWNRLSPEMQDETRSMVREMWQTESLRPQIRMLLMDRDGVLQVTRAFAGHQEDLRELNRWMFLQSLRGR